VIAALELARPAALLALLLPVALLLGSRALARPERVATGTLAIWRRVLASPVESAPLRRRRIPPAVLLLALALVLGALALAGPRAGLPDTRRTWRFLVDGNASMDLPFRPGGKATRRDRAFEKARDWLSRDGSSADLVRVDRPGRLGSEDDLDDAIWITDRAPSPPPVRAAWFASGGAAVPGPVAVEGAARFDWDGKVLVEVPGAAPARSVEVRGKLPPAIAGVLDAWAAARNATVRGSEPPALVVLGAGSGAPVRTEAARDGWSASIELGSAAAANEETPLETWLADREGRRLVAVETGRVVCPWVSMEDPRGDPAAFAVSWARLFDRAVLPPPGVVALADRAAADEASHPPSPEALSARPRPESPLPAWLAGAACLCVAGAWMLGSRW
jgi:hypothetical protein